MKKEIIIEIDLVKIFLILSIITTSVVVIRNIAFRGFKNPKTITAKNFSKEITKISLNSSQKDFKKTKIVSKEILHVSITLPARPPIEPTAQIYNLSNLPKKKYSSKDDILNSADNILEVYGRFLKIFLNNFDICPLNYMSIIITESGNPAGKAHKISCCGAVSVVQIMPSTAKTMRVWEAAKEYNLKINSLFNSGQISAEEKECWLIPGEESDWKNWRKMAKTFNCEERARKAFPLEVEYLKKANEDRLARGQKKLKISVDSGATTLLFHKYFNLFLGMMIFKTYSSCAASGYSEDFGIAAYWAGPENKTIKKYNNKRKEVLKQIEYYNDVVAIREKLKKNSEYMAFFEEKENPEKITADKNLEESIVDSLNFASAF